VNKKVLGFALASIFLVMLVAPVIAGKGQEKLSIRLNIGSYDSTTATYGKVWNSPKKIELPEYGRITHMRGGDWGDPATHEDFMIVVDEGGVNEAILENDDITYSCSYDADFRNAMYGEEALPYVIMLIRVRETWVIDSDDYEGYIEILTVDKVLDYANLYEGIHGWGSFVGHGVINGQSVKLSGESIMDPVTTDVYREGTVMGWS